MSLEFKVAETEKEKDAAFRIRYIVYCDELRYIDGLKFSDKREHDVYDDLETTISFLALCNGQAVGTGRLIESNPKFSTETAYGFPMETIFDLSNYKKRRIALAEASRSCVLKQYRGFATTFKLWKITCQFAKSRKITHFCAAVNPKNIELYKKFGFTIVGKEVTYPAVNYNPAIPIVLVLENIAEPYKSIIEKDSPFE